MLEYINTTRRYSHAQTVESSHLKWSIMIFINQKLRYQYLGLHLFIFSVAKSTMIDEKEMGGI